MLPASGGCVHICSSASMLCAGFDAGLYSITISQKYSCTHSMCSKAIVAKILLSESPTRLTASCCTLDNTADAMQVEGIRTLTNTYKQIQDSFAEQIVIDLQTAWRRHAARKQRRAADQQQLQQQAENLSSNSTDMT